MRKSIVVLLAVAMIGVVGFIPAAGASTQSSWTTWNTQAHPLYNAVTANDRALGKLPTNASTVQWDRLLIAEVGVDVAFASAADSPSTQLNTNIRQYVSYDSQSAAYGLVCVNTNGASACHSWIATGKTGMKYWNLLNKEIQ